MIGLVIYASGFGFPVVVRSMVTSSATARNIPIPVLYSGLAIAETTGSFIGAVVLTATFTTTLAYGGIVAGVPFFICSVSIFSWYDWPHAKNKKIRYFTDLLLSLLGL